MMMASETTSSEMLEVPPSPSTVRVRMIDTTVLMTIKAESFVEPVLPGHELINVTEVAFLVENESLGKRVLFDAGVRKDYWNLPAVIQKRLGDVIPSLRVDKDMTEILREADISLDSIDSIIWSHYHWDHVGNASLFPSTTSITVGRGFKSHPTLLPGYPHLATSPVSASDFAQRDLHEISFDGDEFSIGSLPAHDYFGDGSFYLLDTPGHCVGHMCGLARTTSNTFIFMGGDICHFAGAIRPNPRHPLPATVPAGVLDPDPHFPQPCPGSFFTTDPTRPLYRLSTHPKSAYVDPPTAQSTVDTMRINFEGAENVLVCVAHDPSLLAGMLPVLNVPELRDRNLNDWFARGWKTDGTVRWGWLNELPRGERRGRTELVQGFWREGQSWDRDVEKWERDYGKRQSGRA